MTTARRAMLLTFGIILGACGTSTATTLADGTPRTIHTTTDPGELTDDEFDTIIIDGKPCIVWKDRRGSDDDQYAYSGLTCDWSPR